MNIWSDDPYRDALDPFANDPTDDPLAPTRGALVGLALSVPLWALLGALGKMLWEVLHG